MELALGLPMMNQLDLLATPLKECFTEKPDFTPYTHVPSNIPINTMNPKLEALSGPALFWAKKSMELPLMDEPDVFVIDDEDVFQRLAWYAIMGCDKPFTYVKDGKLVVEAPLKYLE